MFQFEQAALVDQSGVETVRVSDLVEVQPRRNGAEVVVDEIHFEPDQLYGGTASGVGIFEDEQLLLVCPINQIYSLDAVETLTVEDVRIEFDMFESNKVEPMDVGTSRTLFEDDDSGFSATLH